LKHIIRVQKTDFIQIEIASFWEHEAPFIRKIKIFYGNYRN